MTRKYAYALFLILLHAMLLITACAPSVTDTPEVPSQPITVRIPISSEDGNYENLSYDMYHNTAPLRLEFTLFNSRSLDIEAVKTSLSGLDFIKDIYQTIVLDDSMCRFTVELSRDMTCGHSKDASKGYIELTFTETLPITDSTTYSVRSVSKEYGEDLALLEEAAYGFNPSIVKTQSGGYCVIAASLPTEDEARDILDAIDNENFFIEETTVFSSPK